MEENQFSRTQLLIGEEACRRLRNSSVIVFGVGGVGSYVVEALSRSGIGRITVVDNDTVSESNINRQLIALHSTIGMFKAEVSVRRIADINPECAATALNEFVTPDNIDGFDIGGYDYVVDAVDNVTAKIAIISAAKSGTVPVISCMGTGNKLNASLFRITDISATSVCPLARVMRYEMKKRGIYGVKVLWSDEIPKRSEKPPASIGFVPSVAGLLIAGEVVRDICEKTVDFLPEQ